MNRVKKSLKELRGEKPVHEVKIQIFADNSVEVKGFPNNYHDAMDLMAAGMRRVAGYFLAMSIEGKLDDKLNLIKSPVAEVKNPLLGPDGNRLQ